MRSHIPILHLSGLGPHWRLVVPGQAEGMGLGEREPSDPTHDCPLASFLSGTLHGLPE